MDINGLHVFVDIVFFYRLQRALDEQIELLQVLLELVPQEVVIKQFTAESQAGDRRFQIVGY